MISACFSSLSSACSFFIAAIFVVFCMRSAHDFVLSAGCRCERLVDFLAVSVNSDDEGGKTDAVGAFGAFHGFPDVLPFEEDAIGTGWTVAEDMVSEEAIRQCAAGGNQI